MKSMRKIFLTLMLCCAVNVAESANVKSETNHLDKEARLFLTFLLEKNEAKLFEYQGENDFFSNERKIDPSISNFLYGSTGNKKSIVEIAKIDKLRIRAIKQNDGVVTLLFYPNKFRREITANVAFLENEWMNKYFACEFRIVNGNLKLHNNFCFADTGGPFH